MFVGIPVSNGDTQLKLNTAYVEYVRKAGFEPILITSQNDPNIMAEVCNGLLLPGGIDIDPIYYGDDNDACLGSDVAKDVFERALFKAFVAHQKPVFGICRGFQLMAREAMLLDNENDALSYLQDISMHAQTAQSTPRVSASHFIVANINKLYATENNHLARIPVNSMHHQAFVARLTKNNFVVGVVEVLALTRRALSSKSVKEGFVVVEAADFNCWPGARVRGVQWHPEEMGDVALLQTLIHGHNAGLPKMAQAHVAAAKLIG